MKCAMSERLVRLGVSMAQFHIPFTLQRNGVMTMGRLADLLGVSLSNASGLIDRLEERGYVERTRVPEDRRIVMVRVTNAGTRLIEENDALSDELMRDVLARFSPDELPVDRPRHRRASARRSRRGPSCVHGTRRVAEPT